MAEVAPDQSTPCRTFECDQQIAGPASQIEHARPRPFENIGDLLDRMATPIPVNISRKQMVRKVIPVRHATEHRTDPPRGLLLRPGALRSGSDCLHAFRQSTSARSIAC